MTITFRGPYTEYIDKFHDAMLQRTLFVTFGEWVCDTVIRENKLIGIVVDYSVVKETPEETYIEWEVELIPSKYANPHNISVGPVEYLEAILSANIPLELVPIVGSDGEPNCLGLKRR